MFLLLFLFPLEKNDLIEGGAVTLGGVNFVWLCFSQLHQNSTGPVSEWKLRGKKTQTDPHTLSPSLSSIPPPLPSLLHLPNPLWKSRGGVLGRLRLYKAVPESFRAMPWLQICWSLREECAIGSLDMRGWRRVSDGAAPERRPQSGIWETSTTLRTFTDFQIPWGDTVRHGRT